MAWKEPVPVGEGDPASRLGSRTEPPGDGMVTEVPVGRTLPAPRLDAPLQPSWHRRGPPRAKSQAEGGKKSPEPSEVLRQMLEELERGHESEREAVQKEAFPEASSGSLPVSAKETEAMQATGAPGSSPGARSCTSRQQPKLKVFWGRGICSTFRR
ncbi:uncharacterized protein WM294_008105 [Sarcoramphus papa]